MLFKDKSDAEQYRMLSGPYQSEKNMWLRWFLELFDRLSVFLGFNEIRITSYIRNGNIHSCHYWGWAADIGIKEHPSIWYWGMVLIGKAIERLSRWAYRHGQIRYWFRMNRHKELYRTKDQHIHIELRDAKH